MTEESKITQEETAATDQAEANAAESQETLQQKLAEAERKAEENWDKFLRTQAELENLRRRMERELQNAQKYAIEKFAKDLLSVADSLELGLKAAVETEDLDKIREGLELTLKQLLTVFDRFNVRPIDPLGEKFNPEFHQAMAVEEVKGAEPDRVIKVFQKGYVLNDRILRPALVVVARPSAESQPRIDEQA
ncbi:nucleotide exchange factor GrpE [Methylothermus subterraneus]|nr:molecular chaperone GrpE [uncultured Gammaproteobacteria bacterium]